MVVYKLTPETTVNNDIAYDCTAAAVDDDVALIDNQATFALTGNANNERLQQRIVELKGDLRSAFQPLGWTRPFNERMLATVDVDRLELADMRTILRNPDALTAHLGGLAFIRAVADLSAKERLDIPDCIIPPKASDRPFPTVQMYSTEGITMTSIVINRALKRGAETVMTSANRSTERESISATDAIDFATRPIKYGQRPIEAVIINHLDDQKPDRPLGSYPVINVEKDHLSIIRHGCFAPDIIKRIFHRFPVSTSPDILLPNYPGNVLRLKDLPRDVQTLHGPELRLGILAHLGWSAESAAPQST